MGREGQPPAEYREVSNQERARGPWRRLAMKERISLNVGMTIGLDLGDRLTDRATTASRSARGFAPGGRTSRRGSPVRRPRVVRDSDGRSARSSRARRQRHVATEKHSQHSPATPVRRGLPRRRRGEVFDSDTILCADRRSAPAPSTRRGRNSRGRARGGGCSATKVHSGRCCGDLGQALFFGRFDACTEDALCRRASSENVVLRSCCVIAV